MITSFSPENLDKKKLYELLVGGVAPRPIAFASTISKEKILNLSPFSFFNVFSINPPILIFSPVISSKNLKVKDTLANIKETKEVVISIVNYAIVNQASLSSAPFDKEINEFKKSGLTPIPSEKIAPFRVKESPINFECKVNKVIELGEEGGAGNLVLAKVVKIHVNSNLLNESKGIDQTKVDFVSRMGENWYSRCNLESMFEIKKPVTKPVIGIDQIPENIKSLKFLSKEQLAVLASIEELPKKEEIAHYKTKETSISPEDIHQLILNNTKEAWLQLLAFYIS